MHTVDQDQRLLIVKQHYSFNFWFCDKEKKETLSEPIIKKTIAGQEYIYTLQKDGSYKDQFDTTYPVTDFDEKRVGLSPLWETRYDDPFREASAKAHDEAFNRLEAGYKFPDDSAGKITKDFVRDTAKEGAKGIGQIVDGISTVIKAAAYISIGGVGGFFMYLWKDKIKNRR